MSATDEDTSAELSAALHAALGRAPTPGPVVIALSGGRDSTVLLHVAAHSTEMRARGLRALHVDHGLHVHSREWARLCLEACLALNVPLQVLSVAVEREGTGPEASARRARYVAFESNLCAGELLLTAHHAQDQAETLLLRLMRGSGVHGLSGMREWRALGDAWLGRPWLSTSQALIGAYARDAGLDYIDDPSNADVSLDRNYLRAVVMPTLAARWPHAGAALARSAGLLGGASDALAPRTHLLLARLRLEGRQALDCHALHALDDYDIEEVLRAFVAEAGAPPPPARVTALVRDELLGAASDASPALEWRGFALRRFRGALHLTAAIPEAPRAWSASWNAQGSLMLPGGLGSLHAGASAPLALKVSFRRGGERMRIDSSRPSRTVKSWLQESDVPPWLRDSVPLVHDEEGVAAIGDLVVAERLRSALAARGAVLRWQQ